MTVDTARPGRHRAGRGRAHRYHAGRGGRHAGPALCRAPGRGARGRAVHAHDLLRAYAADRAAEEDAEPERVAALARLFDWYRHTVDAAARLLYPEILRLTAADPGPAAFTSSTAALAWLDAERPNLVAAVVHGTPGVGWTLSDLLRGAHSRSVARPATAGTRRTA